MNITGKSVLITGANRGIGRALVTEALGRDAATVYAATRQPLSHPDPRVVSIMMDVTDAAAVARASAQVPALDVLVNNAGLASYDDLSDRAALDQHLAVNLFGTHAVTQAFLPQLAGARGAIVNVLSLSSVAAVPVIPAYSVSKAAAFSLTQSLRALLAARGVRVHAALLGPVDTDMSRGLDVPKTAPDEVARAIFDGMEKDEDDIFPDPASATMADGWRNGPVKAFEREFATLL